VNAGEEEKAADAITVVSGTPTPDELAAVTAVISEMLDEAGDEEDRLVKPGQSAWQRSQRQLRGTLTPGYGAWRGFSA
jgi:hypothetical protein